MKLYVICHSTGEVVKELDLTGKSARSAALIYAGLYYQMNHEDYYLDDGELEKELGDVWNDALERRGF